MRYRILLLSVLFLTTSGMSSGASAEPRAADMPECTSQIAQLYRVPPGLLKAIRHREGGALGKESKPNRNQTTDIGPMQINSAWLQTLSVNGITRELLTHDYCTNVVVGAWVLRTNYDSTGEWSEAIAAYNAGLKGRKLPVARAYAADVISLWNRHYADDAEHAVAPPTALRVLASNAPPKSRLLVFEP